VARTIFSLKENSDLFKTILEFIGFQLLFILSQRNRYYKSTFKYNSN